MQIARAEAEDAAELARLVWLDTCDDIPSAFDVEAFAQELATWWTSHDRTHHAFVARQFGAHLCGMAWVAVVPRVPRPGQAARISADIQTVFVEEAHRGVGIGSALVHAAAEYATSLGATRVTVHSSRKAVPVYERLGFDSSRRLLQRPAD
jgi:GNAT superfamily N-acetyltransferase